MALRIALRRRCCSAAPANRERSLGGRFLGCAGSVVVVASVSQQDQRADELAVRGDAAAHMPTLRTELNDLARQEPARVERLALAWSEWAKQNNVLPWTEVTGKRE